MATWRGIYLSPTWTEPIYEDDVQFRDSGRYLRFFTEVFEKAGEGDHIYIANPMLLWVDCPLIRCLEHALSRGVRISIVTRFLDDTPNPQRIFRKLWKSYQKNCEFIFRSNLLIRREMTRSFSDSFHAKFIVIWNDKDPLALLNSNVFSASGFLENDELVIPTTDKDTCEKLVEYWNWLRISSNCTSIIEGWVANFADDIKIFGPNVSFWHFYKELTKLLSRPPKHENAFSLFKSSLDNSLLSLPSTKKASALLEKNLRKKGKNYIQNFLRTRVNFEGLQYVKELKEKIKSPSKKFELWRGVSLEPFWTNPYFVIRKGYRARYPEPKDIDLEYYQSYGTRIVNFLSKCSASKGDEVFLVNPMIVWLKSYFVKSLVKLVNDGVKLNILTLDPSAFKLGMGRDIFVFFVDLNFAYSEEIELFFRRNKIGVPTSVKREVTDDTLHSRFLLINNEEDPLVLFHTNQISSRGFLDNNELCVPLIDKDICESLLEYWRYLTNAKNCKSSSSAFVRKFKLLSERIVRNEAQG